MKWKYGWNFGRAAARDKLTCSQSLMKSYDKRDYNNFEKIILNFDTGRYHVVWIPCPVTSCSRLLFKLNDNFLELLANLNMIAQV